jgi:flagellar protein FliO/FliZ
MDLQAYLKFVSALVFVLALIGALVWLARRFGLGARMGPVKGARRLAVIEVMVLDAKRRLVLVRRDEIEHLLLLGGNSEIVVEAGIRPAVDARKTIDFAATLAQSGASDGKAPGSGS